MSESEDRRFAEALDDWSPATPPRGFADGVLTALDADSAPRARRRRWLPWAAALVATAATWAAHRLPTPPSSGSLAASGASEIVIGERAVAVHDAVAHLSWHVSLGGATTVTQTAGRVFYRVSPGAAFAVETPAGRIDARGTCFEIDVSAPSARDEGEIAMMKGLWPHLGSGLAGAAIAAVAFVTVYEGEVSVAAAGPPVALASGQRAVVATGQPPARIDAPAAARAELARLDAQRRALVADVARQRDALRRIAQPPVGAVVEPDDAVELARLRLQVAALEEALELEQTIREEREGEALPFPEDLPHAFTEEGLREAFTDGLAAAGLDGEITGFDCSEFPCIVYGEATVEGDNREAMDKRFRALNAHLADRFGEDTTAFNTSVWGTSATDDQGRKLQINRFAFAPYPRAHVPEGEAANVRSRLRYRNEQSRASATEHGPSDPSP